MAASLRGIATVELLKELQRRMACAQGEEKRTIFFGPPGNTYIFCVTLFVIPFVSN